MEIIELRHEVCYRSLEELLEDVCPRNSMIALSSVRIKSQVPPLKSALAILSEREFIIVHDIQDAIDYTSAENLMLIGLDDIKSVNRLNGSLSIILADEPELELQESSLESELRQIGGFDTSFATLCAALEELVGPFETKETAPEEDLDSAPVVIIETPETEKEAIADEEPNQSRKWGWLTLLILIPLIAGICFFVWNGSKQSATEDSTTNMALVPTSSNEVAQEKTTEFGTNTAVEERDSELQFSENVPVIPSGKKKVLEASSFKETIYGEIWPNNWTSAADANKSVNVKVTSKGSLYQVEYVVNGTLKQTLFVVPNKKRSKELATELSVEKVNSYSNPSTDGAVHVDVINGTLDDLITNSGQSPELHISIEAASYAAAFRF